MFFYMGGAIYDSNRPNRAIMVILTTMRNIMSSVVEMEHGALLYNTKELESLRKTLTDMGHPQ